MLVFEATLKQIKNNEFTFEDIRDVFQKLNIRTIEDFKQKKKIGEIKVPSFDNLNVLCKQNKGGRKFEEFFFGKVAKQDKLIDEILIKKIKEWCKENDVNSKAKYFYFLKKGELPEEFPTRAIIEKNWENWFAEILNFPEYEPTLEDKLFEEEFINSLKEWCIENNIDSIRKYETERKNKMPSYERIRQIYGSEYFEQALGIKYFDYEFLNKEEARQICIKHSIFTSNNYPEFYKKYNEDNDKKLPSDPYRFYQTNWSDFIQLSATQLFISNSMSSLELFTYKLLYDRDIDFEIEKTFDDCRSKNPLPFDFYLPNVLSIPVIIELDGEFHRMEECNNMFYSKTLKERDKIKNKYCKQNDIHLIRIKNIAEIEPVLNEKIMLNTIPKVKDLDWTSDFQTENEIIESSLPKSVKVKLLLLMAERGKSKLSNIEIINHTKIKRPSFYKLKNELINLNLIDRPNEYHYAEDDFEKMALLWKQGKNLTEISKETGYINKNYLVKRLKEMGIDYKSRKKSKEGSEKLRSEIISLHKKGVKSVEISKKINVSQAYISSLIKGYKINTGELIPSVEIIETAKNVRTLLKENMIMKDIAFKLNRSPQYLYQCLLWTENSIDNKV